MEISCEYLLRYSLKFLKYSGGYGETRCQKLLFTFVLLYACLGIPEMVPVIQARSKNEFLQNFSLPLQFFSTFIKAILYFRNRNHVFELIFGIDYIPEFLAPKKVKTLIMQKTYAKYMKFWKIYGGNVWGGLFSVMFIMIWIKELYIKGDFGIEKRYDNPMYWMMHIFLSVNMMHGATIAMTLDSLPAGIYCGIMMRLQVLQNYVKRIGEDEGGNKELNHSKMIKIVTIEYAKIEKLVRKAETTFNGMLLVQIIMSFFIIATALLQMSEADLTQNPSHFFFAFGFAFGMVLELFIPMIFANDLEFESENLMFAVYSSNWLNLNMRNRRNLILMQEGIKKPLKVRCLHWMTIDLSSFTTIIQIAYKWYTLMRDISVT